MREILVDFARRKQRLKRGGGVTPIALDDRVTGAAPLTRDVVAIDDALNALELIDPRKVRVVELRFFAGLTIAETGEVLGVSPETVQRDWRFARLWLYRELGHGKDDDTGDL